MHHHPVASCMMPWRLTKLLLKPVGSKTKNLFALSLQQQPDSLPFPVFLSLPSVFLRAAVASCFCHNKKDSDWLLIAIH